MATHIGTAIRIALPSANVTVFDGDYCYNILLPYVADEIHSVLLLSSMVGVKCVFRVIQALASMGIKTLSLLPAISVSGLRDYISRGVPGLEVIEVESDVYRFAVMLSTLRLALEIGGDKARIKRIEKELKLKDVVNELIDRYREVLSRKYDRIAVTKALLSAAEELVDRRIPILVLGRQLGDDQIQLLVYTSVEDHIVNEYVMDITRKGVRASEIPMIRINTDPLTAPIYALVLFYAFIIH